MSRKRAFTLIELLVVIAIISLLVSILLPSLNMAKELARRTVCLAQMKNMGLPALMYADGNNDCLPVSRGSYGGSGSSGFQGSTYHWYNLMSKYTGLDTEMTYDPLAVSSGGTTYYGFHDVFKGCPNYDAELADDWNPGYGAVFMIHSWRDSLPVDEVSIYMNFFDVTTNPENARFWKRNEFERPTKRGWFGESIHWHIGGGPNDLYQPANGLWPTWARPSLPGIDQGGLGCDPERHDDSSNIWFIDGHAQYYRYNIGGNAFFKIYDLP